uniref:TRDC protein n=1 Tax=Cyanistes caeruleus TaxID=156563 RepID=A0A8C0ZJB1_CYACU
MWKEWVIGMSPSSVKIDKLIFGPGTTLTVVPNIPKTSLPQVIVMKSRKLKEGGSTGKAACLARNFITKNISLEMPATEVVYEQSRSILTSEGLYNAIKVVSVTQDTEVTCTAKFANNTITSQPATEEENEEPETEASKRVCNSTDTSAQDPDGQRVNMLSMAVLGLRVLLAKSIAFNALMSIKLFLF